MDAADYSEWCRYAGLYLDNLSHADRYRTYQRKLSQAGLVTRIVHDFLQQNEGGFDLRRWRSDDVYEVGGDAAFRVEQTALALEAIGAPRVAAKVRTARDTSISAMFLQHADDSKGLMEAIKQVDPARMIEQFRAKVARAMPELAAQAGIPAPETKPVAPDAEIESWEQVEHRLQQFVRDHEQDLRDDVAKYGDVRAEPGFDPEARMQELDGIRRREADRQRQRDDVAEMVQVMEQLETKLGRNPAAKPGAVASPRRKLVECYRRYSRRPAEELIPEVRRWLEKADRFQARYAALFRPQPVDDPTLLKRLDEIGPHDVDIERGRVRVSWDSPAGLECDWTTFSLALEFPAGKKKFLARLLGAIDRLRRRFPEHQARLRGEVLENFEIYRDQLSDWQLEDYELDDAGRPTEPSILAKAGDGSIHVGLPEGEDDDPVELAVYFRVEWDQEHGLELSIEDEPDLSPAESAAAASRVTFRDPGPALTPEDVAAFEQQYEVALPPDYRDFLLAHNGGRPVPDHARVRMYGQVVPMEVDRLFSMERGDSTDEDKGLGTAIIRHLVRDLPAHLLPIGRARMPGPLGGEVEVHLLLGLRGKHAGKVLIAVDASYAEMPSLPAAAPGGPEAARAMAGMFESLCQPVAPNVTTFLSRLIARPSSDALADDLRSRGIDDVDLEG